LGSVKKNQREAHKKTSAWVLDGSRNRPTRHFPKLNFGWKIGAENWGGGRLSCVKSGKEKKKRRELAPSKRGPPNSGEEKIALREKCGAKKGVWQN